MPQKSSKRMTMQHPPYRFGWFDWFCLWYPPGWLILFNRHWQHYKPDPEGWNWVEYLLFLLPGGFYLALLFRWLRLGMKSPRPTVITPDPVYQKAFQQEILTPIIERYFRGTLQPVECLPADGPLIIAMNHAGMCFPWDFMGLAFLLSKQRGWFVQPLAHPIFFDHPWLVWWLPQGWAQTLGGVRAERHSFEAAAAKKTILLYAPEGWRGLVKGWQQRYQLTKFDPSFIRLSLQHQIPILPVVCMGNEYLHPFSVNLKRVANWLKLPLFPISPLIPIFLLFPSMGAWAVRTHLRYYIQPLWCPWEGEKTEPGPANEHPTWSQLAAAKPMERRQRAKVYQMAEDLRSHLQSLINHLHER